MIEIRSFRDIVRLYYIFRRTFLVALLVTALLITAGAFFWPPSYTSESRLLVRAGRENVTVPLDVGERQAYTPYATQRDPIIDEEKMLTGQPVVMQVARLYLDELSRMPPPQGWKQVIKARVNGVLLSMLEGVRSVTVMLGLSEAQSPEERLAKKLAKKFSVSHGVGSNVMELSFTWDDPLVAQRIMQTWIKAYTDERTMVLGRKSLVPFYDGKVRGADQQIESLKEQMRTRLAAIDGVHALTDITGFGLAGHVLEMARGSATTVRLDMARVPLIEGVRGLAGAGMVTGASGRNWAAYGREVRLGAGLQPVDQALLSDPQTSGGLLVACAPDAVDAVLAIFEKHGFAGAADEHHDGSALGQTRFGDGQAPAATWPFRGGEAGAGLLTDQRALRPE